MSALTVRTLHMAALGGSALLLACSGPKATQAEVGVDASSVDAATDAAAPLAAEFENTPFAELVRSGRLEAADRVVSALPPGEREKPPLRFLRAKLALELGRAEEALKISEGLDTELPLMLDRITVLRAEAFWRAGRAEEAGDAFARLGGPYAIRAAEAYARAGNGEGVRKITAGFAADPKEKKSFEANVRRLRLRFEDERLALEDARWLATIGAAESGAEEGMRYLREKNKAALSESDLQARGKAFAEAGMIAEARQVAAEVERGGKPEHRTLGCMMRATALFHSRASYKEAERAFATCEKVAVKPDEKAAAAFLAARSLLRANLDDNSSFCSSGCSSAIRSRPR